MSNYHYREGGCTTCIDKSSYSSLEDTTKYSCDQYCLCRHTDERSDKDKMYYDWFVKGEPMRLPAPGGQLPNVYQKCQK
jgi:hypothetical protein